MVIPKQQSFTAIALMVIQHELDKWLVLGGFVWALVNGTMLQGFLKDLHL